MLSHYKNQVESLLDVLPSVRWKLQNLEKLRSDNPEKYREQCEQLKIKSDLIF